MCFQCILAKVVEFAFKLLFASLKLETYPVEIDDTERASERKLFVRQFHAFSRNSIKSGKFWTRFRLFSFLLDTTLLGPSIMDVRVFHKFFRTQDALSHSSQCVRFLVLLYPSSGRPLLNITWHKKLDFELCSSSRTIS